MEQSAITTMPIMDSGKQKDKKGLMIITIITSILAVCGIGFGVYSLMQSMQKDRQISDLKAQLKEDNDATAAIEVTERGHESITDAAKVSGGPYIENGYFYVPEWGLKFSVPSDLANYGYSVSYDTAHTGYTLPSIGFTAMLKSDERQAAQVAYYDNIETCSIVSVSKEAGTWPNNYAINGQVKQFDDYALLIWNYSRHDSCDYGLHIDEVQEKIQTMFSNPEKI